MCGFWGGGGADRSLHSVLVLCAVFFSRRQINADVESVQLVEVADVTPNARMISGYASDKKTGSV